MNANSLNIPRSPFIVDLERSLLRSDLAIETLFALLKEEPFWALRLFMQMLVERNQAIEILEKHRAIDAAYLPYNTELISQIEAERRNGTSIHLVSQHYHLYAQAIARHLKIFDRVIVSGIELSPSPTEDPSANLEKLAGRAATGRSKLAAWLSGIRMHQWLKNLLVFVPLVASHWIGQREAVLHALLAFVLFGLCASSVYLLNDLLDLNDDRRHPTKQFRALAAGRISIRAVLVAVPLLLVGSLLIAWYVLPAAFCISLAVYYLITLVYSLGLKRMMMLDVVVLAVLYTLRMVAGTLAINGQLTFWMLAFSLFIFISLALAKRYAELVAQPAGLADKALGRGYFKADLPIISGLGIASGYISVMVLALYIQDQNTVVLYRHPKMIWLACPLLLFWIGRTWMLAHRGLMHDDPIVFAVRDRVSLVVAVLFGIVFVLAA